MNNSWHVLALATLCFSFVLGATKLNVNSGFGTAGTGCTPIVGNERNCPSINDAITAAATNDFISVQYTTGILNERINVGGSKVLQIVGTGTRQARAILDFNDVDGGTAKYTFQNLHITNRASSDLVVLNKNSNVKIALIDCFIDNRQGNNAHLLQINGSPATSEVIFAHSTIRTNDILNLNGATNSKVVMAKNEITDLSTKKSFIIDGPTTGSFSFQRNSLSGLGNNQAQDDLLKITNNAGSYQLFIVKNVFNFDTPVDHEVWEFQNAGNSNTDIVFTNNEQNFNIRNDYGVKFEPSGNANVNMLAHKNNWNLGASTNMEQIWKINNGGGLMSYAIIDSNFESRTTFVDEIHQIEHTGNGGQICGYIKDVKFNTDARDYRFKNSHTNVQMKIENSVITDTINVEIENTQIISPNAATGAIPSLVTDNPGSVAADYNDAGASATTALTFNGICAGGADPTTQDRLRIQNPIGVPDSAVLTGSSVDIDVLVNDIPDIAGAAGETLALTVEYGYSTDGYALSLAPGPRLRYSLPAGFIPITTTSDSAFYVVSDTSGGFDVVKVTITVADILNVYGNSIEIESGDFTPRLLDFTDFGFVHVDTPGSEFGHITRTFELRNEGGTQITLNAITSSNDNFKITFNPVNDAESKVLNPAESSLLQVTFEPTVHAFGRVTDTATITIGSTASTHTFGIKGVSVVNEPEIHVTGKGIDIYSGDTTPDFNDGTDFLDGSSRTSTFIIHNRGTRALNLNSLNIVIYGQFSRHMETSVDIALEPNEFREFTVTLEDVTAGTKTGTVIISSDDPDEPEFTFQVGALITADPNIMVVGNSLEILHGDTTPSYEDFTNLGVGIVGSTLRRTFVVRNVGGSPLTITSVGVGAVGFQQGGIVTPIAAGGSSTVEIRYDVPATGIRTDTIRINTNDPDTPQYTFRVQANGVAAAGPASFARSAAGVVILSGDMVPSVSDTTHFGTALQDNAATVPTTFFFCNQAGAGDLNFPAAGAPFITVVGADAAQFRIIAAGQPAAGSTIAAGSCINFRVEMSRAKLGILSAAILIKTDNDPISIPYTFAISGMIEKPVVRFFRTTAPTAGTQWVMYYLQRISWEHNLRFPHVVEFKLYYMKSGSWVIINSKIFFIRTSASTKGSVILFRPHRLLPGTYGIEAETFGNTAKVWGKIFPIRVVPHP